MDNVGLSFGLIAVALLALLYGVAAAHVRIDKMLAAHKQVEQEKHDDPSDNPNNRNHDIVGVR